MVLTNQASLFYFAIPHRYDASVHSFTGSSIKAEWILIKVLGCMDAAFGDEYINFITKKSQKNSKLS